MNDNNNDKPFECKEKGCLQKFSNVDHLSVHLKKHEMKLKFNPNDKIAIEDQTPTPSRFLGNFLQAWDEVGLNNEITEITNLTPYLETTQSKSADTNTSNSKSSSADNPFAHSFKNALTNKLQIPDKNHRLKAISDSPLNTPAVFVNNEGLMAIANAALHPLNTPDPDFRYDTNGDKDVTKDNTIGTSLQTAQPVNSIVTEITTPSTVTTTVKRTSSGPIKVQLKKGEPSKTLTETNGIVKAKGERFKAVPVIRTANANPNNISISQTLPNILISQPNNKIVKTNNATKLRTVPIAQTTKSAAIIAPKMKDPALTISNANNSLYKVILKLPDGRSVQLPLIQQPITPTTIQPTFTAITNKANDLNSISTTGTTITSQLKQTSSNSSLSTLQSKVDATLAALPPKAKPGRKSKFAPEEDPREKKARSLERNRAAAMRCRLKRKHWIDSLEEKADEYEKINEKLQNEVVALRREVTLLKTALLAHKDCPVTLQQQKTVTNVSAEDLVTSNVVTITNGTALKITNGLT